MAGPMWPSDGSGVGNQPWRAVGVLLRQGGARLQSGGGTLAGDSDNIVQRCGDVTGRVEVRASASHCDARGGHGVQEIETIYDLCAFQCRTAIAPATI